jgi:hypothetical protein
MAGTPAEDSVRAARLDAAVRGAGSSIGLAENLGGGDEPASGGVAGISVLTSRPTDNVYLTAAVCNAPARFIALRPA